MPFPNTDVETTATEIAPQTRVLQVIHLALMGGVVAYFLFQVYQEPQYSDDKDALPLIPLVFAATNVIMSFVVPSIVRRSGFAALRGKSPIPTNSLMNAFQTGHIVGIAMLEGAGMLGCFALTGGFGSVPRWFLVVPVAVLVLMLLRFPRQGSVAEWITATREELAA